MNFKPALVYNLFQLLAALLWLALLYRGLRHDLGIKKIFVMVLSTLIAAPIGAQIFPNLLGYADSQSHYGALGMQILVSWILMRFVWNLSQELKRKVWTVFSIASSLVYSCLRFGCFFRGCCWGKLCPFPWAVTYRSEGVVTPLTHLPLHPVQLYSALHGFLMAGLLYYLSKRAWLLCRSPHWILGFFLFLLGLGRLLTDHFRADPNPNFWINIFCAVLGAGLLVFSQEDAKEVSK